MHQRPDHQHRKEQQENGIDDLTNPDRNLTGSEREEQNECKENCRENQKRQRLARGVRQHRRHAGGKRRRCAAGDGKERSDGQVQKARKEHAVALADLAR